MWIFPLIMLVVMLVVVFLLFGLRVGEKITSGNSRPDLRQIRSRRLSETASVAGLR
jgi:hypothetical protein